MAYANKERMDSLQRRLAACRKKYDTEQNPRIKDLHFKSMHNLALEMMLVIRMSNKDQS